MTNPPVTFTIGPRETRYMLDDEWKFAQLTPDRDARMTFRTGVSPTAGFLVRAGETVELPCVAIFLASEYEGCIVTLEYADERLPW